MLQKILPIYIENKPIMRGDISSLLREIRSILITEDKHTNVIVNVIGLPTDIANWITENYPEKLQLWVANNFKTEAVKKIAGNKEVVGNIMIKMLKGDATQSSLKIQLNRQKSYFQGAFQHIIGWLQNRRELAPETDEINLKTLSFDEAVRRADAWEEAVKRLRANIITDESGKIIKTYDDGFYWLDLQTSNCRKEASAMGHCGSASGTLYSLRKAKQPYLTADVHRGNLIQLRGRANTKPKAEYHNRIIDFLLNSDSKISSMSPSSYRPEQNFELKDLSIENINNLYSQKPKLFVAEELYKVLLKYPEFATRVNFKNTPLFEDHKEHLGRLHPEMKELIKK